VAVRGFTGSEGSSRTISCDLNDNCEGDRSCSVLDARRGVASRGEDGALRNELVDAFRSRFGDALDVCRKGLGDGALLDLVLIAGKAAALDCRRAGVGGGADDRLSRSSVCDSRAVSLDSCDTAVWPALLWSMVFRVGYHMRCVCRETCLLIFRQ